MIQSHCVIDIIILTINPLIACLNTQCDANPEVSKVAIMEDKYENILTLITYYQMVTLYICVCDVMYYCNTPIGATYFHSSASAEDIWCFVWT